MSIQCSGANGAAEELYRRGMAEQAAGRLDAAIKLIDEALRLRPDFPEALFAGGFILQGRGFAAAALAFYDRALVRQGFFILMPRVCLGTAY